VNGAPFNPLRLKVPNGARIPKALMAEFRKVSNQMSENLASIIPSNIVATKDKRRPDGV